MKKKIPLLLASTLTVSMLGACSYQKEDNKAGAKEKSSNKQVLNLTETAEIPTMDTTLSTDATSSNIMNNTMEGLYRLGKDDKLVPGVAKSYEKSEDGKKYVFKLREDAKWSNGEPVTAKDFVYSWRRAVDSNTGAKFAYILFDVKNAEKVNKKELPVEELGVKAIDDHTLEVELDNPVPYFVSLTVYPTLYPLNEKFVTEQGAKFGLESNTTLYNGPFVLNEWKHEQSFQLKKNPSYWENKEVKLEEINFNIVKDRSTAINLYETKAIDRVVLTSEFVDKYKSDADFKTIKRPSTQFIRLNEKNKILANKNIRKAIAMSFERENIGKVILNDGSEGIYGFVPKGLAKGPNGKDFREENGKLIKEDMKEAQKYWEAGKKELGVDKVELELLNFDTDDAKKIGEYLKGQFEKNLPGLTVPTKMQPFAQKLKLEASGDYAMSYAGWSPDYMDPMSFLEMYTTGNAQNKVHYANPAYDDLIKKAKTEVDVQARWDALLQAEKQLLEDAAIAPVYQPGKAYLQRGSITGLLEHKYGGEFSYKWVELKN
ncbi:peptide ABC transporter substrate-binding protein [Bacillus anthracis]|uniref:peptide ABC transporter substrate-binding protein n=1 Tax=Bacillus TaxID=1386 RepID=UPI0010A6A33D|nr:MULTISPECIES: peptide ABC transporter substrate-binding protein [Bacillus]MCX9099611.1 peptide ABC transporter substrate-binding protein [Bacillus anthracis]MDA1738533.1 peptide ABC transporter substrate-binding protein [Bacillus cereus]MDA1755819.1 peptide ABC transporter substrate-binding protein [Bacillus cereus]MDA2036089.1 peptide ABC transporter substrate-binding protein [Bacillus cereus]MDA2052597.1 peptide ABC transporter substrate-binding protein [Bacillus cereus]